MKTIITIIIVLIVLPWTPPSLASSLLKFDIGLSKQTYLVNEPIWLDMTLFNVSQDSIRTHGPCPPCGDTKLEIFDEKGDSVPLKVLIEVDGPGYLLAPGEKKFVCHNLLDYFGMREDMIRYRFNPGKYSLKAIYQGASVGAIETPVIYFEVKDPIGEEKEALKLLKEGYKAQLDKLPDLAIHCFEKLIKNYPNSVYIEPAYFELGASYRVYKGDVAKSDSLRKEMLERIPDSGYSKENISTLIEGKSVSQQKSFLQELIEKYPQTRTAKFAEKMLNQVKKNKK